jgi:hypothetical protein
MSRLLSALHVTYSTAQHYGGIHLQIKRYVIVWPFLHSLKTLDTQIELSNNELRISNYKSGSNSTISIDLTINRC